MQLVREARLVALVEAHKGLPELRTLRVFLEGTAASSAISSGKSDI